MESSKCLYDFHSCNDNFSFHCGALASLALAGDRVTLSRVSRVMELHKSPVSIIIIIKSSQLTDWIAVRGCTYLSSAHNIWPERWSISFHNLIKIHPRNPNLTAHICLIARVASIDVCLRDDRPAAWTGLLHNINLGSPGRLLTR